MGLCCPNENNHHYANINSINNPIKYNNIANNIKTINKTAIPKLQPISKDEYQKLLQTYKYAVCKIITRIKNKEGKETQKIGTGFFCEINDNDIRFKKALFTNNHILGIENLQINRDIVIEYLENIKVIKITENRKRYTSTKYDYTCIEIFDSDDIKKFFQIDKSIFDNKRNILKEIFIFHYPKGKKLSISYGKIQDINNNIIIHDASTLDGSSGSALINRYNTNCVFGIHFAGDEDKNLAIPFDIIINNIKQQISGIKRIKLIYELQYFNTCNSVIDKSYSSSFSSEGDQNKLFGTYFVKNNRYNIKLIINGEENDLVDYYNLNKGINLIELRILNILINLEDMFYKCESLKNIEGLEFLNTEEVHTFKNMFYGCINLSDLNPIKKWDVSKGNNFECMFNHCKSLIDLDALKNWDVSNGINFSGMFTQCKKLKDLNALKNWNVSKGDNFGLMFFRCKSLEDLNGLKNWNVSNGLIFLGMFSECVSLSNINGLKNWNISNGKNFSDMFALCKSIKNLEALKLWNFCNAKMCSRMFENCLSLTDINCLKNWNVSNIVDFSSLFCYCISLSDITALKNWDVSNGINFSLMFKGCKLLKDIYPLKNWNVSKGERFNGMFEGCSSLSDIYVSEIWNVLKGRDLK